MNIQIRVDELYERGLLDKFCEVKNIHKSSSLAGCDVYELTEDEAKRIGLISKKKRKYYLTHHDDEISKSGAV